MPVKVFATMTGENAELFTSQSGALVCMGVCQWHWSIPCMGQRI